jgi:hypothetical protein
VTHRRILARRKPVVLAMVAAVALGRTHVAVAGAVRAFVIGERARGFHGHSFDQVDAVFGRRLLPAFDNAMATACFTAFLRDFGWLVPMVPTSSYSWTSFLTLALIVSWLLPRFKGIAFSFA